MRERFYSMGDRVLPGEAGAIGGIGLAGLVGSVELYFADSSSRGGGGGSGQPSPNGDRPAHEYPADPSKDPRIVRPVQQRPPKG